jgi:drug/metabolite transporter (DMT)-like permease
VAPADRQPATDWRASLSLSDASEWRYIWLGIISHLIWGSYPVFGKRAVAEIPRFSLLLVAAVVTLVAAAAVITWRDSTSWRESLRLLLTSRVLWVLAIFVVARSVTNIISIELTRATWVQLINILTPFPVALLGAWFFDQPVPRYTYRALVLSSFGAALMLVPDWSALGAGFSTRDIIGLATAVVSTLMLAAYFQLVRRSRLRRATGGLILFQQSLALLAAYAVLTLAVGESWAAWRSLSVLGWVSALWVIGMVMLTGNFIQIVAVGGVSPARVTNFMALRLISAFVLAWLILGEGLTTLSQWLGVLIVVVTVTAYLWLQSAEHPVRRGN